jgi:radical SAM-linked protein
LTDEAGAFSNRDIVLLWEQALGRAGYTVSHSEGKRPSPQIALAAPLPLGVTSDCELVDVFLSVPANPDDVLAALKSSPPTPGIEPAGVEEMGVESPSLQSQLRWAEYKVTVASDASVVEAAANALLSAATMPVELQRATKVKRYDLRPLVIGLQAAAGANGRSVLTMRLRAAPEMTARADQVVLALGLPPAVSIHRTRLELEEVPEAILAYRRKGGVDENGNP